MINVKVSRLYRKEEINKVFYYAMDQTKYLYKPTLSIVHQENW